MALVSWLQVADGVLECAHNAGERDGRGGRVVSTAYNLVEAPSSSRAVLHPLAAALVGDQNVRVAVPDCVDLMGAEVLRQIVLHGAVQFELPFVVDECNQQILVSHALVQELEQAFVRRLVLVGVKRSASPDGQLVWVQRKHVEPSGSVIEQGLAVQKHAARFAVVKPVRNK